MDYEILQVATSETVDVSVIIPVFNTPRQYLEECLSSLDAQDKDIVEIVLVDDASRPETLDVLMGFAQGRDNVTVLRLKENKRQGAARNRGLTHSRGSYIGYMDPDDLVSSRYFEKMFEKAQESDADMVAAPYCRIDHTGKKISDEAFPFDAGMLGKMTVSKRKSILLAECPIVSCIYRKELLLGEGCSFPEGVFFEDNPPRVFWKLGCRRLEMVEDVSYLWRLHSSSTTFSSAKSRKSITDRVKTSNFIIDEAIRLDFYLAYRDELDYLYGRLCLINTLATIARGNQRGSFRMARDVACVVKDKVGSLWGNKYVMDGDFYARVAWWLAQNTPSLYLLAWRMISKVRD